MDTASKLIASTTIRDAKSFPVSYTLKYNPSVVVAGHTYSMSARITGADGSLQYINDVHTPATLTGSSGPVVDIAVIRGKRGKRRFYLPLFILSASSWRRFEHQQGSDERERQENLSSTELSRKGESLPVRLSKDEGRVRYLSMQWPLQSSWQSNETIIVEIRFDKGFSFTANPLWIETTMFRWQEIGRNLRHSLWNYFTHLGTRRRQTD